MDARLVHGVLTQYDGAAEARGSRGRRLRPEFDFDELRRIRSDADPGGSLNTSVEVAFSFTLSDADDIVAQVSACFRLLFESSRIPTEAERHAIVCDLAPREAWPLFRAHVDRTLAEMGFSPYHGNRQITPVMAGLAASVLAQTEAIDRELAQKLATHQGRRLRK